MKWLLILLLSIPAFGEVYHYGSSGLPGFTSPTTVGASGYIIPPTSVGSIAGTPNVMVSMFDANNGIAVSSRGYWWKTSTAGVAWTFQGYGSLIGGQNGPYTSLYSLDSTHAWIVNTVYASHNLYFYNGTTWTLVSGLNVTGTPSAVTFFDANNGWVVGSLGNVYHTTNGGTSWTLQPNATGVTLESVSATSASTMFVGAYDGNLWQSTNSGTTLTQNGTLPNFGGQNSQIFIIDANHFYVLQNPTGNGLVFYTADGGSTWANVSVGSPINALYFTSQTNGTAVGLNGTIYNTTNGGVGWTPVATGFFDSFTTVQIKGNTNVYGSTFGEVVLKTNNAPGSLNSDGYGVLSVGNLTTTWARSPAATLLYPVTTGDLITTSAVVNKNLKRVLDVDGQQVNNALGVPILDMGGLSLNDSAGLSSYDIAGRVIADAGGFASIDGTNRATVENTGNFITLDWQNNLLASSLDGTQTLEWGTGTSKYDVNIDSNITVVGGINSQTARTTVNCSTSGSVTYAQPMQGLSYKKVVAYEAACTGTAAYTYPKSFSHTPQILSQSLAATVTSISNSAATITGAASTGFVELTGF